MLPVLDTAAALVVDDGGDCDDVVVAVIALLTFRFRFITNLRSDPKFSDRTTRAK